jgi:hypothetical protein
MSGRNLLNRLFGSDAATEDQRWWCLGILYGGFFWRIPIFWAVIPAIACAIGAIPFLGGGRAPVSSNGSDGSSTLRPSAA